MPKDMLGREVQLSAGYPIQKEFARLSDKDLSTHPALMRDVSLYSLDDNWWHTLNNTMNDVIKSRYQDKIDKIEDEETYLNYMLDITYKGTPIRNMDYTFWGGQDWSNIYSAKDGVGVAELPVSNDGNDLRVKIEYSFEGEAK